MVFEYTQGQGRGGEQETGRAHGGRRLMEKEERERREMEGGVLEP
jgi:hypothetical protein